MGSLLRFYGKKRRKGNKESEAAKEEAEQQQPWRMGEVKVQVYHAAPTLEIAPTHPHHHHHHHHHQEPHHHHHHFLHLHCEVEFDPEKDYAQVLAEARSHLKVTHTFDNSTTLTTQTRPSQHHLDAFKELHSKLGKPNKSSKLWRYFLFWKKPSNYLSEKQVEAEFESIFSSPPHPSSKASHKGTCNQRRQSKSNSSVPRPTRKGTSGPLNHHPRPTTRKNNSGPLYTDGLPVGPFNIKHTKKSYSGPLGFVGCNNLDSHLSPYQPLQYRPPAPSPLYSC